jgi:DNA-binding helix-hairpin-helix protein with protein kinase domain
MAQLLKPKSTLHALAWARPCVVQDLLGGGGQGEVYRGTVDQHAFALKWYHPNYLRRAPQLRQRVERAIQVGPPSDRFLWPLDLTTADGVPGFGYLMKLREPRFRGLVDWLRRRVNPSFRALATAGFELADSFLLLHAGRGLCYRDINYNNVFFDPATGEVRICDNDNVDIDGQPGEIGGTPSFMAPEIVRAEALPSIATDRYSLAVLLFYLFMLQHPLEGRREAEIHCLDLPARRKLYGHEPVFIFDPGDASNRPVPGIHDNALAYWPLYPRFLRELFTRAFTAGLRDPRDGRVLESEWRPAMILLRDSVLSCSACRAENFYDAEALRLSGGKPSACWHCRRELRLPFRIRIGKSIVVLAPGKQLFPHHIHPQKLYDFSRPVAEAILLEIAGLKNLSAQTWLLQVPGQEPREVQPGETCPLANGAKIQFGTATAEVRG